MKINEIILNELKEYIDPNMYGAWINIDGRIDNVTKYEHLEWFIDKYGESFDNVFSQAFKDGWVRIVNTTKNGDFSIEGKQENIKKTFKLWWPSAIKSKRVIISNANSGKFKIYNIPVDKNNLIKDIKFTAKPNINKEQINELKEYISPNSYGAWINIDGQIDHVYSHYTWIKQNYKFNKVQEGYNKAYADGWIRVLNTITEFIIQGPLENIRKTFKLWWPTARLKNMVVIESNSSNKHYSFAIPTEQCQLLKTFGPNYENK